MDSYCKHLVMYRQNGTYPALNIRMCPSYTESNDFVTMVRVTNSVIETINFCRNFNIFIILIHITYSITFYKKLFCSLGIHFINSQL